MSKKLIVLIEIVFCVASIVFVSIFGTVAESWRNIEYCKSLEFTNEMTNPLVVTMYDRDNNITTDNNLCYRKTKSVQLNENQTQIQLTWKVLPDNSTNSSVYFEISNNCATISENGLLTFQATNKGSVTVTISTCDGSLLSDYLIVKPYISNNGGNIILD